MSRKKALLKFLLISTCIVFPLIFLGVVAVLAAYIGPNRTVTTTTWERQYCNYRASITSPAGSCYLNLYDSPGSCPSTSSVADLFQPGPLSCGSSWPGTCGAGLSCNITLLTDSTQSCSSGETGCTQTTSTTTYPPATVSGTTACTLPGNAGWCRGTATLNLSGNEPLAPGYSLTIFEGSPGILCSAPACAWAFPEGNTSLNYWVHSTFGDTSTMSSASMLVDSMPPTVTLTIPPPNGANGWFVSSATASASATDATSGVSSVSINGGGNTFFVSADGIYGLTATASDNAGNTSTATGTMKLDTTIPTFMLSVSGTSGAGGWYVSSVHINSGAVDVTSGLGSVQYSVDGGALQAGSSVTISTDGTHTVSFKAIDNAGNMSTSSTQTVKVDATGPAIAVTLPPADGSGGWYKTAPVTVTASASDAISGLSSTQYSVDGGTLQAGSSALISTDGMHTVSFRAVDNAGNITTSSMQIVNVDTVVPTFALSVSGTSGSGGWYVSSINVDSGVADTTSGLGNVQHSVDGGAFQAGSSATISADGTHTVSFQATDNAGNMSTSLTQTVKVDTTVPTFSPSVSGTSGANGWYVSPIQVNSGVADAASGLGSIQYSLDGGAFQASSSVTISTDGPHTVSFQAVDNAGNAATSPTQTINIDMTGPAITVTLPTADGLDGWYKTTPVTVAALANDATSGLSSLRYSVDGGAQQAGTSALISTDGTHTVSFIGVDNAGNTTTSSTQTVKVDTTGPAIAVTLPSADGLGGWYKTVPVTVTALASDATSGLSSIQYSVDGGALQAGSSALISTDGTHTVSFRAVDNAGNMSTSSTQTVKVDTTGPAITSTTIGTMGGGGWFITTAQVLGSATDATSGLAGIQYSIDGGSWQSAPIQVGDGTFNVQIRATDVASNTTTNTVVVKVDIVRPASLFVSPPEGTSAVAAGDFTMTGHTVDVDSGPQAAEVSIDNGANWQALPAIDSAGNWSFVWDTTGVANGTYTVFVRATDLAGNQEHTAKVTVIVSNQAPFIKIAAEWWIWEAGQLVVEEGSSPISGLTITVSDPKGRWPNRVWSYYASQIPGSVSWDRHFGETIAPSGNYDVKATVCDIYDSCSNAYGIIKIPYPSTPTPTPVASQTPARTPAPTQEFPTEEPTKQVVVVVPVSTPAIVKVLEHPPVGPAKPQFAPKAFLQPRYLFPTIGMVSLFIALAATRLTDKRPRAIRQLAQSLKEYGQQTNRFNP